MLSRIEDLNSTGSFIKNIDSIHTTGHAIPANPFRVSTWKTEQNKVHAKPIQKSWFALFTQHQLS